MKLQWSQKNEENVAKTSSEKIKPAPAPAPIIPKTDEAVWKKEIRECEAFVQECDFARGIQKLNINHKKVDSCQKCSYVYKREDIDEIEDDVFSDENTANKNKSPINNLFGQLTSTSNTDKPKMLQLSAKWKQGPQK